MGFSALNRLHLLNRSSELLEVFTYMLFVWRCLLINTPFSNESSNT